MLFGVVDLARDKDGTIAAGLAQAGADVTCLFAGELRESLRRRAPYLLPLPPGSRFTALWQSRGWGAAWGILIRSNETAHGLRRHLRQFLRVQLPDGRFVLLRFYDPRVLPAYLRSCNREELEAWFIGITAFRIESDDPRGYREFCFDGQRLVET